MKKALIFFSLSGNTKDIARKIAMEIGADVFEVKMKKSLPDVMWKQILIGGRQATFGEKPEIYGIPDDFSNYDEIIIGTPIWAGKVASPITTVLANRKISKKVTAVFTLSGSGNNEKCIKFLRKKLPNLNTTISLTDKKNESAKYNTEKIKQFIEKISTEKTS